MNIRNKKITFFNIDLQFLYNKFEEFILKSEFIKLLIEKKRNINKN